MSQSVIVPPVHDTSPPPFDDDDDDVDDNDFVPTISNEELLRTTTPDALSNSNDDWKSVDDNNETDIGQIQDELSEVHDQNEEIVTETKDDNQHDWANFATFENKTDEVLETSAVIEENKDDNDDWADFESSSVAFTEPTVQTSNVEETKIENNNNDDDDDDFGEFSEVQTTPETQQTSSLPTNTLTVEQIDSLLSTCFPIESVSSSTDNETFLETELPSFTTSKDPTKQISYLESSLSLWKILSNLSNDPIGIQFQWRKSNSEKLFHQALGVNERFRTKTVPLTPEVLQPERIKSTVSTPSESENVNNENKISTENLRPHFDWKQSGLQNPLADNDSSSLSSNMSKNEETGFDANKSLDLDFYVPSTKSSNETAQVSTLQRNDSPVNSLQRSSISIKTTELHPNSTTTTLNDEAKRIVDSLPNFSFMSAKALMFPIRFNANNTEESTTLY